MSSLNKVMVIGRLGADPEVKSLQNGGRVVNMRLAVSERWTQNGEKKEKTEWIPVVIWNEKLGEIAEKYVRKGSRVFVEGAFNTRKWTDQQGQDRYSTEVVIGRFRGELVLLDSAKDNAGADDGYQPVAEPQQPRAPAPRQPQQKAMGYMEQGAGTIIDDQIPFAPEWR